MKKLFTHIDASNAIQSKTKQPKQTRPEAPNLQKQHAFGKLFCRSSANKFGRNSDIPIGDSSFDSPAIIVVSAGHSRGPDPQR
jgi:hypothetical protein